VALVIDVLGHPKRYSAPFSIWSFGSASGDAILVGDICSIVAPSRPSLDDVRGNPESTTRISRDISSNIANHSRIFSLGHSGLALLNALLRMSLLRLKEEFQSRSSCGIDSQILEFACGLRESKTLMVRRRDTGKLETRAAPIFFLRNEKCR
jgi:hypothetical protein